MITITMDEFNRLAEYIKVNYGISLKEEKRALVTGRLQNVLTERGFHNFTEYYNYVQSDKTGDAVTTLVNKITTNHTFFMREADHFQYVREFVLPELEITVRDKDLRIWSAGCSTGEEPYTLAMMIDEYFGKNKMWWDAKILATDISSKVLDEAKKGVYHLDDVNSIPTYWKMSYFKNLGSNNYEMTDRIKNEVIFRKFNLMEQVFPFKKKFHIIFCRNVMIYFDKKTKEELVDRFYNSLEYGGYLFIGHSESLNREDTRLKYVRPAIYRKL